MSIAIESKLHAALTDPEEHATTARAVVAVTIMHTITATNMSTAAHGLPGHVHGPDCKH